MKWRRSASRSAITDQHDIVVSGLEFRYNDPDDGTRRDMDGGQRLAVAVCPHRRQLHQHHREELQVLPRGRRGRGHGLGAPA